MFERSLLELIRGIRRQKGNEQLFIQDSLRECKTEIKSKDMDLKANALLKLLYLEMFGHDMSWASFQVLEVMSSTNPEQKRIGYLGAIQTFRPNTDVLLLATNLLKKDLSVSSINTFSLPLLALPHLATPSLSLSLLPDVLPRLTHSSPTVRKKAFACLYMQSIVYPDTIRLAWPRIVERLMDEQEDTSVTFAIVNLLCELAPTHANEIIFLAQRLFELLVDGHHNWMAIRILKLFTILIPLEGRLIKKLVKPVLKIMQETVAMSLLYECINGIIQAGILARIEDPQESDEIANLCVEKLAGLILMEEDGNLQFVSLLAFLQILTSHPQLVAQHRDAIIGCIDNPDASIRLRALDIIQDIVNAETLVDIVEHLMEQLRDYGSDSPADKGITARERTLAEDDEDADMASEHDKDEPLPSPKLSLALEEKLDLITRVVHMGVKDTYTHVDDFNWLISVMLEILGLAVLRVPSSIPAQDIGSQWPLVDAVRNHVASELRNVLVKVKEYRQDGVLRTEDLLLKPYGEHLVLGPLVWLIGEYSDLLIRRSQVFDILLRLSANLTNVHSLCICIHTLAKLFTHMTSAALRIWDRESTTTFSLSCARLLEYLQVLMKHAEIEVQECACQYGELFKLVSEALNDKESDKDVCPQLVALALPSLFTGLELNAVSAEAQNKIPLPEELNLDDPFSPDFSLGSVDLMMEEDGKIQEQYDFGFYHRKVAIEFPTVSKSSAPLTSRQSALGILPLSEKTRKGSPLERNVDDPFFLSSNGVPAASSADAEFDALDIESIPILDFPTDEPPLILSPDSKPASRRKLKARVASEEDLPSFAGSRVERTPVVSHEREHGKSGIELNETEEDREMRLALQEVERSRLKMQREAEKGALAEGVKPEGTVVKRKKRKKRAAPDETGVG